MFWKRHIRIFGRPVLGHSYWGSYTQERPMQRIVDKQNRFVEFRDWPAYERNEQHMRLTKEQLEGALEELNIPDLPSALPCLTRVTLTYGRKLDGVVITGGIVQRLYKVGRRAESLLVQEGDYTVVSSEGRGYTYASPAALLAQWSIVP